MSNTEIQISNKEFTEIKTAKYIDIKILNIVLFSHVIVSVIFKDLNKNIIKVENIKIEGEDYLNWGNNDNFIIEYVTNLLNIQTL